MRIRSVLTAAAIALAGTHIAIAGPFDRLFDSGPAAAASGTVEAGFSPEGSAEQLVKRALAGAKHSIRLSAFSLTSPAIVRELVDAKRRGVDVAVVADEKQNASGKGRAALNLLVNAGIPTRTVNVYFEMHDKFALIDGETVQTGSFNYSVAAARHNSENAIVVWRDPALAKAFLDHWQSRWVQGVDVRSSY
ncbi:phospholipase D family nuclease [Burkholderia pseudomallei]|uniref:phospholipase D family nuclease n=1 Tax=Burkholderia pseudomallei TaxID=28450 RepID=UPI000537F541|nr:phospholipase D family protein [Burkholderia pseudomallei]KGW11726.1 endonuclease [Burkholderia pseudomallei MSHR4000]